MQPGKPNPDIRNVVEDNRGIIKKIQLHIPGFKEYRIGDDLRVADALLRKQVSENLNNSITKLQSVRSDLASDGNFQNLTLIGSVLSKLQQLDGEILHSAQGYTGISPAVRIDESKLKSLYQYDLAFLDSASKIDEESGQLKNTDSKDSGAMKNITKMMEDLIFQVRTNWEKRLETVENILISGGGQK